MNQPQLGLRRELRSDEAPLSRAARGGLLHLPPELPVLSSLEVRLGNRLVKPHQPGKLEVEGLALDLRLRGPFAASSTAPAAGFDLALAVDGSQALVRLPTALVNVLIARVESDLSPASLEPRVLALLLELALAPLFDLFEAETHHRIAILSAAPTAPIPSDCMAFEVDHGCDGITTPLLLFLNERSAWQLAEELARRPLDGRSWEHLPTALAFRSGITSLTLAELAGLRPGDFVIFDQAAPSSDQVVVVAAERWMFLGQKHKDTVKLSTGRKLPDEGNWERWTMSDSEMKKTPLRRNADSEFDDLSVTLCFDVGRPNTTLGELRKLDAGYVFELQRKLSEAVDIYANGHRIGAGELVRVADSLGVRVTRLFNHG